MTHRSISRPGRAITLAATALCGLLFTAAVQAQTWEYKSYKRDRGGQWDRERFNLGAVTLEERDGKASFASSPGGRMPACAARYRPP